MTKKHAPLRKSAAGNSGSEMKDDRFASMLDAPIFKKTSNKAHKVVVDDRFKVMLTDERFQVAPGQAVDAYGRKKKKGGEGEELKRLYGVEDEERNEEGVEEEKSSSGKTGKGMSTEERLDYLTKLSRGEISEDSSSDESSAYDVNGEDGSEGEEDSEGEDMDVEEEDDDNRKSALDIPGDEDIEYGDATKRISILNCDWEHIRAEDLLVILQSFCPPGKQVLNVTIYPSDFGKERMALEDKFGPQGIWKNTNAANGGSSVGQNSQSDEVESDLDDNEGSEEEDENEDLYDNIEDFGSDEEDEEEGEEEEVADEEDDENDKEEEEDSKNKNGGKYGDFQRKKGAVGIVLHDDLRRRRKQRQHADDDDDNSAGDGSVSISHSQANSSRSKKSQDSGFDEVALREYELSKLRYYFAIAECDCVETANVLYEQLDDVELEDSAMALEIRFVPDDLDLSDREMRDTCNGVSANYKPPDAFQINALQHTNVKCTWDEGEQQREKKLTNISAWRQLKDSDFLQYIASSDSDDEEVEEEVSEEEDMDGEGSLAGASMMSVTKKQQRAKSLRSLLLGADAGSDKDSDEDEEEDDSIGGKGKKRDDFFLDDNDDNQDVVEEGEDGEMVLTYIPEAGKELLDKKREKDQQLTPYELDLKKSAELKKARKEQRKAFLQSKQEEQEQLLQQAAAAATKKPKSKRELVEEQAKQAQERQRLQNILNIHDEDGEEEDKLGSKKANKKHKKNKKKEEEVLDEDAKLRKADKIGSGFVVDVSDDRFKKVFEGDSAFGIDRTAHEFKETIGMKKILDEQRKSRNKPSSSSATTTSSIKHGNKDSENNGSSDQKQEMNQLVNRLKRKFNQ